MQELDEIDYKILTALGKNPLATITELSKETEVNVKTLSKRLQQLIQSKVIRSISAQISPAALGQEPVILFINTKWKNISIVEKVGELHPYTRFSARCLGAFNGLMNIFMMPRNSLGYLLELFDRLRELGLIDDYTYLTSIAKWTWREADFTYYDVRKDEWTFDWDEWGKYVESLKGPAELEAYPPSILHKLDKTDMALLRELSKNARAKFKDLSEKLKIPEYQISRRIKLYLDNGVIEGFRILIYSKASNLFDQFIFKCRCPVATTAKFAMAFKKLPFPLTFMPTQEGFTLVTLLPPSGVSYLGDILQRNVDDVKLMWADYRTSRRYWFYGETFKDGVWQADRKMLVDDILMELKVK
ncbi:MAG: AsnC family transcriptional regulator [archaeon YNP-LCB-003-016]|uniref:Lrp/AsnC family transcriptional regulator n=1 Tax=Candidatus Culexarchaeum yellowstonense TaxID=2928963 RepID=UPI0026F2AB2D|nr:winged helix-turn-helix transcriptional regulator [Candidatus Culexarchaeum yellowstonense]MCR6693175.1 AsnC family transcriptional regulator [Candidatus Culexarchaeum yellowstonense]